MAVHRHRETQFDPHKFWFVGFHHIGVAQTYWYPNCFPFFPMWGRKENFMVYIDAKSTAVSFLADTNAG